MASPSSDRETAVNSAKLNPEKESSSFSGGAMVSSSSDCETAVKMHKESSSLDRGKRHAEVVEEMAATSSLDRGKKHVDVVEEMAASSSSDRGKRHADVVEEKAASSSSDRGKRHADVVEEKASSSSSDRETAVHFATMAEESARYEDVIKEIKKVTSMQVVLTAVEKMLISVGYKNLIESRRASWRMLTLREKKEESKGNEVNAKQIKEYRQNVETEINHICNDAISVIKGLVIPLTDWESNVYYHKMLGDYYRYLAEIKSDNQKQELCRKSTKAYETATANAQLHLPFSHPTRLSVALNYSVYCCEIMKLPKRAIDMAKKAYNDAEPELDSLNEQSYKASAERMLQLLKANIEQWKADMWEELVAGENAPNYKSDQVGCADSLFLMTL